MRQARVKIEGEAYYHVTSRCALQEFLMDREAKDVFVKMMRRAATFSGVEIITYCVMDNHFHILLKVPERRELDEDELRSRISTLYGHDKAEGIFNRWQGFRNAGDEDSVREEQEAFLKRMYDLSEFGKTLKQRYSMWYRCNRMRTVGNDKFKEERGISGTIWEGRFHSVVVEPTQKALTAVAAYIDMNPVRAKIVADARRYRWSGYGASMKLDPAAKTSHLPVEGALYASILEEKTHGFARKLPNVARGVAFGSREFVKEMVVEAFGDGKARTQPRPLAQEGDLALLCSAGRRANA